MTHSINTVSTSSLKVTLYYEHLVNQLQQILIEKTMAKVVWEYHDSTWQPYAQADIDAIEVAYANFAQQPIFPITIFGKNYQIDFVNLKQTNLQTKYERNIRRRFVDPASLPIVLHCNPSAQQADEDFSSKFAIMSKEHIEHYCKELTHFEPVPFAQLQQKFKDEKCPICMCEVYEENADADKQTILLLFAQMLTFITRIACACA